MSTVATKESLETRFNTLSGRYKELKDPKAIKKAESEIDRVLDSYNKSKKKS